jgi:single-strand DNA-binding protein
LKPAHVKVPHHDRGASITVIGNLTADPGLRFTGSGTAVAHFTIASTPRTFDAKAGEWTDGETLFLSATAWNGTAEHAAASLTKGMRVIATGTLKTRSYTTKTGEGRTVIELEDIGPSLRRAIAEVTRTGPGPDKDVEHPADRFSLSARAFTDYDLWFGIQANPAGRINVPGPDAAPALQRGTMAWPHGAQEGD